MQRRAWTSGSSLPVSDMSSVPSSCYEYHGSTCLSGGMTSRVRFDKRRRNRIVAFASLVIFSLPLSGLEADANTRWREVQSDAREVEFDPSPVDSGPTFHHIVNDWATIKTTVAEYGSFFEPGANATIILDVRIAGSFGYFTGSARIDGHAAWLQANFREYSKEQPINSPLGELGYVTFISDNAGIEKSCVCFYRRFSPRRMLTGFYCRGDTQPLNEEEIRLLIEAVRVN